MLKTKKTFWTFKTSPALPISNYGHLDSVNCNPSDTNLKDEDINQFASTWIILDKAKWTRPQFDCTILGPVSLSAAIWLCKFWEINYGTQFGDFRLQFEIPRFFLPWNLDI